MPTNRRLDEDRTGVKLAARLARRLGTDGHPPPVVVLLCSGAARAKHLPRDLFSGIRVLAIDVPPGYRPIWPHLRTETHILSTYQRSYDVGLKRNLGLVLARMYGWKYILLLDDDIGRLQTRTGETTSDFSLANVADALFALGEQGSRAVGWVLEDFPDNSVVCHARGRLAGLKQDKFIGGGALLLRCDQKLPFFPSTYNEDWLFLLPFMLEENRPCTALIEGGLVGQDPYPVYVPKRAQAEELGDMLGEGLFNLLTIPRRDFVEASVSYDYWHDVVASRKDMIEKLVKDLSGSTAPVAQSATVALVAALDVHRQEKWSSHLVTYARQWHDDVGVWNAWLPRVERGLPLAHLGLGGNACWWTGGTDK